MTTFQPRLIGRNQEAIDNRIDNWTYAIETFNELAVEWRNLVASTENIWDTTLKIKFDLNLLRLLLNEKYATIEKMIKETLINADPDYAKFAKRTKIEEILRTTKFPEIDSIIETLRRAKEFAISKIPPAEFDRFAINIWDGEKFDMINKIILETEAEFTYFTTNNRENLVLEISNQLAASLSLINKIGGNIRATELPNVLKDLFATQRTGKKYSELNFHPGSESKHEILSLIPSFRIRQGNQSIFHLLQNLSDKEVDELYSQLTNHK